MSARRKLRVVIVTGLSGAGKTVALRALEDSGFFCIDNLPVTLIPSFLSTISDGKIEDIGIGVDIREKAFLGDAYQIITALRKDYSLEILFFEAEKGIMIRRFKETRRPHPMLKLKRMDIEAAIDEEMRQLAVLRESADKIVDTSNYTPHQLRHMVISWYGRTGSDSRLDVTLISFGYKYGIPLNADLLFDVRFLPNPYFVPELKSMNGLNKRVHEYVFASGEAEELMTRLLSLLDYVMPHYIAEGRSYLAIGVGCTGGMHRSPAIVSRLADYLRDNHAIDVSVIHRDMA